LEIAKNAFRRVGEDIVRQRKRQLVTCEESCNEEGDDDGNGTNSHGEDMLGMMMKANMGMPKQRAISDEDLLTRE
jgi:hypothetical protein